VAVNPADDFVGWTPVRLRWDGAGPVVDWCHTEGVAFREPFFSDTVQRCLQHPFRLLFHHETGMEDVGRFVADHPGLAPTGFIFHMSRCGSTLVAQMLAAVPEHLVLSEPGPLDAVLRAPASSAGGADQRGTWLRWMVAALGQPRGSQRALFVKFDAWSVAELALVRRTFPDVPWIFLFRDPVAVLVSHGRRRGAHVIPGALPAAALGLATGSECTAVPLVEHAARVLARICEQALEWSTDPLATFVDYDSLPGFVIDDLLAAWSVPVSAAGLRRIAAAARRNAKNPCLDFEPDGTAKRKAATPEIRAAADRWLAGPYERLRAASTVHRQPTDAIRAG
jgi:hypothetical protein